MAEMKTLTPMVEVKRYIIVVSIPLEIPIDIVKKTTIDTAEKYFIAARDKTNNHNTKVELDRARALLKWASCSYAGLLEIRKAWKKLMFYFNFSSIEDMLAFRDSLSQNVEGVTIK